MIPIRNRSHSSYYKKIQDNVTYALETKHSSTVLQGLGQEVLTALQSHPKV